MFNKIEKAKEIIVKAINEENDMHVLITNTIKARKPADMDYILEQLAAVHRAKVKTLEDILDKVKTI